MSAGVDLGLYRNFVSDYKGQYAVTDENKNEQARFTEGMGGKTALTGYDVSGTGSALGRGLERIGRAIGSAFRLLGRLITFGHVQPPHKNYEVRMAFKDAILAHLRQNSSYGDMKTGLEGKLPPEILDKFKGELNSNKPLTKRRIKIVLEAVDKYVAANPKPQVEPKKADALPKEEAQSKTEKTEVKEEKPTRSADVVKQEIKELEERVGKLRAQIQNYDNVSPDDPKTDWSQVKDVRLQLIGQDYSAAKDQLKALNEELKQVEAKPIDEPDAHPYKPINSKEALIDFLRGMKTAQSGKVVAGGKHKDINGIERQLYTYQGLVFRADSRHFGHETLKDGFTSKNDLRVEKHLIEAMGLGAVTQQGVNGAYGATGTSGVSCARTVGSCINYALNDGSCLYIIDTTKIGAKNTAWDMSSIVVNNELGPDRTGNEVNVSHVPREAVVGYIKIPDKVLDLKNEDVKMDILLKEIELDPGIVVFNDGKGEV